ncbi:MAG: ABC transporter permease [Chloroflexi bacterium]|nr:ABC transporter permease [Chloroflexota bacterium]
MVKTSDSVEPSSVDTARIQLPYWLAGLLRHRLSVIGGSFILFVAFLAVFAPLLTGFEPTEVDPPNRFLRPSFEHLLGTDYLGRDQFTRLIYGARISMVVGIFSVVIASFIGVPLGLTAAHFGGWTDSAIMRFIDAKLSIPGLILAMMLLLMLGGGVLTVSIALGINLSSAQARLIRSQALSVKEREYFHAARAMGTSNWRLILLHMMPNSIQPVIVQASLGVGFAILGEASLSFLGLGVTPPTPTWGNMLSLAFQYMRSAPYLLFAPGVAILLLVMSFSFVGDGLRDVLDPRLKGKI